MPNTVIAPKMTRAHYQFIADNIGPHISWPSKLHEIADKLAATNPRFDKDKFIQRATKAWEDAHLDEYELDDEIRF